MKNNDIELFPITLKRDIAIDKNIILTTGQKIFIEIDTTCMMTDCKYLAANYPVILKNYRGIIIYDTGHTRDNFSKIFPNIDWNDYLSILKRGIDIIIDKFSKEQGMYAVISTKYNIMLPLDIRPCKYKPIISVIGTLITINKKDRRFQNQNEIDKLKEQTKDNKYCFVKDFNEDGGEWFEYIFECGKVSKTFVEILLE